MEAVWASFVTGVLSLIGVIVSGQAASKRTEAKITTAQAVTDTKIEELTREVRYHNEFARRVPVMEEQLRMANHRISDLEENARVTQEAAR